MPAVISNAEDTNACAEPDTITMELSVVSNDAKSSMVQRSLV